MWAVVVTLYYVMWAVCGEMIVTIISRFCEHSGIISEQRYIVEIYYSGRKPSNVV